MKIDTLPRLIDPARDKSVSSDLPGFGWVTTSALSDISIGLHWEFQDLTTAYEFMREKLEETDRIVEQEYKEIERIDGVSIPEVEELRIVRKRESLRGTELMMGQIARTTVKSLIVNSWIIAERVLKDVLVAMQKQALGKEPNANEFWNWNKFQTEFKSFGIVLSSLPGYELANLCRLTNNAIKHDGKVSPSMGGHNLFKEHLGKVIRDVHFNPQGMFTHTNGFCNALLEVADGKMIAFESNKKQ